MAKTFRIMEEQLERNLDELSDEELYELYITP